MVIQEANIVSAGIMNGTKTYMIVIYKYNSETGEWKFGKSLMNEVALMEAMINKRVVIKNACIDGGKLKGTTGSLERFHSSTAKKLGIQPKVIISEIRAGSEDGKIIGYRIANPDGSVSSVKISDLISYCNGIGIRAKDAGVEAIIFQNAIYVPANANGSAHIKGYKENQFIKEVIRHNKVKNVVAAKEDVVKETPKRKIEDIFTPEQIDEIKAGKSAGVDVRHYLNPKLSPKQMAEIRKALINGVNPRPFAGPEFSAEAMKAYRIEAKYGVDISKFVNPKYSEAQIYSIATGMINGIDISKIADPNMSVKEMDKISVLLLQDIFHDSDVSVLEQIDDWFQKNDFN